MQKFPRLGLICRADTGGLGSQTHDFYRFMHPDKVMLMDIDLYTGYHSHYSKYEDCKDLTIIKNDAPNGDEINTWLNGLDVVFTIEAPYNHDLYAIARSKGIKTVCQYNYEWLAQHADSHLPKPDLFLAPSSWHMDSMSKFNVPVKYLHVPVDREKFPFKLHKKAKKFLHIAGHKTFGDRNGTAIVLEALPFIESDIEITIRSQDELPRPYTDHRLKIIYDDPEDNKDIYNGEDVLILPRRYGGLSLQLNEALSLGMVPIMTDCAPQNGFLKEDSLVQPTIFDSLDIKTRIDVISCKPDDLARQIDLLAGRDITKLSKYSDKLAHERDWKIMAPKYRQCLQSLFQA